MLDRLFWREEGRLLCQLTEIRVSIGCKERCRGDHTKEFVLGRHDHIPGADGQCIGHTHVGSESGWRFHRLVHPNRGGLDDDGSTRRLVFDPCPRAEELTLEPRPARCPDHKQRPRWKRLHHRLRAGGTNRLDR